MDNKKKFRLPKAFAEEWLTVLRSGNYRQGRGYLYDENENEYCCLGVACAIKYPLHYLRAKNYNSSGRYAEFITTLEGGLYHRSNLKFDLKKIPNELKGNAKNNDLVLEISNMNDDGGFTFNEIADWIEQNVEFYDEI